MLYKAMEKAFSTAGDTSLGLPLLPEEPEPHTPYRAAWLAPGPSTENACEKMQREGRTLAGKARGDSGGVQPR